MEWTPKCIVTDGKKRSAVPHGGFQRGGDSGWETEIRGFESTGLRQTPLVFAEIFVHFLCKEN